MCERSLRRGDGALQVFAPVEQIVDAWAWVFANWGHNESNEINREHKLRGKKGPVGVGAMTPVRPAKSSGKKNLCRKSKSNVSGLWAKVSWRNKSFSQQSQREIIEHSIGMHSGQFLVPKGSFLIFWTGLGRGKVAEDTWNRRNRTKNHQQFKKIYRNLLTINQKREECSRFFLAPLMYIMKLIHPYFGQNTRK